MYRIFFFIIILIKLNTVQLTSIAELELKLPENCKYEIIAVYDGPPVNQTCISCLCETFTDCNLRIGCNGYTCGPFRITKVYWQDAGALKLNYDSDILNDDINQDYVDCTNDYKCSVNTIQGYMGKYGVDGNDDDIVDCYDYALLHYLGKDNIINGVLPRYLTTKLSDCLIREELFK